MEDFNLLAFIWATLVAFELISQPINEDIPLNNRDIDVRFLSSNTVWFKFQIICGDGRSQNDYIEISKIYQNVFISDVPKWIIILLMRQEDS